MESNEISMFMDVKLDIHDKKSEALKFKSWMKCLVKIEAIKCLPCFLRITFIRNVEDEAANLSVSINIPGITISLASSRTKQHSYGIFWMQNRKRCFIYFAVDSESSCRRHMKWMKKSIKNLELHRQIFLETRRSSRGRLENNSGNKSGKQNLQAILGPLPKIPDGDSINWSRRVSGMSGIYEEIPDGLDLKLLQQPRGSIASGIYEEMKPTSTDCKAISEEAALEPAPPLPPRKRINTFEQDIGIPRSNTNPESELAKKKKYKNVLDNIFGRSKRSESVSEGQVSTAEDLISASPDKEYPREQFYVNTPPNSNIRRKQQTQNTSLARKKAMANKRNSFSSPDLSKINAFDDLSNLDENSSFSSELLLMESLDDSSIEIIVHKEESPTTTKRESLDSLNISEQIQPNFNFSCNSSSVNLVGSNLNIKSSQQNVLIDDNSGYCAMAPIVKEQSSDSDKENDDDQKEEKEKEKKKDEHQKSPNESAVYENMANSSALNKSNLYENIGICLPSEGKASVDLEESYYQTPRKSVISIDDKIPSYYPNSCDTAKMRRRSPSIAEKTGNSNNLRHLANIKVIRRENLYISSPQKIIDQRLRSTAVADDTENRRSPTKKTSSSPLMARKISENVYTVTRQIDEVNDHHQLAHSQSQRILNLAALQNIDFKFDDTKNESDLKNNCMHGSDSASRIYQKYATLARITPNNKYIDKCSKSKTNATSNDLSNVKKFTSLPRFKKIDFSPLKLKINNVLQRHHNNEV